MTSIDQLDDPDALRQLLHQLSQRDPAKKIPAIHRCILLKEKAPRYQLLQALKFWDAEVRAAAAEAIEALQQWITDEQWLETLQKPTRQIYVAAIRMLASLGKDAPLRPLFSSFVVNNSWFRSSAHDTLRLIIAQWSPERQEQVIQLVQEKLQQGSSQNRIYALEMLGLLGEKMPIDAFLPGLNDSEARVRLAALEQLRKRGQQGDTFSLQPLAPLLSDPDADVRCTSLSVIDTQKDDLAVDLLITALGDSDEKVIQEAANMLSHRRVARAIPQILELALTTNLEASCLYDYDYYDTIIDIFQALSDLHAYVPLEPVLNALESKTEKVRKRAINILGLLQERTPVELLLKLLDSKDTTMCKQAIIESSRHLKRLPREAIVDKLKDSREEIRQVASWALLRAGVDIPADLLLPFLDGSETIARATALEILGKQIPMTRLIAATRDPEWIVRQAALQVLGTMGEQAPLEVFLEALCDPEPRIRRMALVAEERIPVSLLIGALHEDTYMSYAATEILEKLGKRVPQALLVQALSDPLADVRESVIQLLLAIEYEEGFPVETIRGMFQDPDENVREAAILALNQVGAFEPAEPFIAALNDSESKVREAALLALANLGERAPREPLKALLGDGETYQGAIECLQKTHPDILREVTEEASNLLLGKEAGPVLGSHIQEHTAEVIGNMHNPGPLLVNKLVALLDWPNLSVRRKAEQALRKLGKELVRPGEFTPSFVDCLDQKAT